MREILFRGKRTDNGEWVMSENLIHFIEDNQFFISESNGKCDYWVDGYENIVAIEKGTFYKVDPETVGQFTGYIDKNGKKIFDGDIILFDDVGEEGYECKEGFGFKNAARVVFNNGRWELADFVSDNSAVLEDMTWYALHTEFANTFDTSEVIGNIHDNPELLKGDE